MDKYDYSQLELFSQDQGPVSARPAIPGSLKSYIKAYEKAVIGLIIGLVVAVAAYSLGVERGKKIQPGQDEARAPASAQETPKAVPAVKPLVAPQSAIARKPAMPAVTAAPAAPAPVAAATVAAQPASKAKQPYTIQIGSFSEKAYAKKEADLLKRKGYQTNLVTRGKYVILCVGAYPDKTTAQTQLTKLQKQYQGCFIRRL